MGEDVGLSAYLQFFDRFYSSNQVKFTYIQPINRTVVKLMNDIKHSIISCTLLFSLLLPTSTYAASQPASVTYTVSQGDNLYKIARTYQTSVQSLLALNNLTSDKLQIGQVLLVPASQSNNQPSQQVVSQPVKQQVTASSVGQPTDLPTIDQSNQSIPTVQSTQQPTDFKQASVNVPSLNVRATPSTTSDILTKLTWGTLVDIVELGDEWTKITYNGQEAYVATPYITYPAFRFTASDVTSSHLMELVQPLLKTRYIAGGSTPDGFDCSGFTLYVYQQLGITLPRTSEEQFTIGQEVPLEQLQSGDLLFYDSLKKGKISHVAMYIGDGMIVHANGAEVRYEKVENMHKLYPYYGAKRYLSKGELQ